MSQVSQQVFMERPQDCRAWEETGVAGSRPGQFSLETVKGNVGPRARAKQSRGEPTATLGGFILDRSLTHSGPSSLSYLEAKVGGSAMSHNQEHFWKNTSTMQPS